MNYDLLLMIGFSERALSISMHRGLRLFASFSPCRYASHSAVFPF
jgi:hypothetical protein